MTFKNQDEVLSVLADTLEQRITADASQSYVAQLNARGLDVILKKVGEEATETVIAAKGSDNEGLVYEVADLWFHTLVLLAHKGLRPEQILAELQRRMGTSGLVEKAARNSE